MRLDFNLHLQQEQKLVMTQELQLAVKILQLTSMELNEYIQEQLIENPMLEIMERDNSEEAPYEKDRLDYLMDMGNDYRENYQGDEDSEFVSPLNFIAREKDLWEYLKDQLNLLILSPEIFNIGEYIIDNIDENGYLTIDTDNIINKFNASSDEVESIITLVQSFEPVGICARSLSECLIIQLRNIGELDSVIQNIVENMLEDVADGRLSKIAKQNGISMEEVSYYVGIIKGLEPKPGKTFSSETPKYIVPDVIVEKHEGKYLVTVNNDYVPHLKINNLYRKLIRDKSSPEYKFIKDRMDSALWIIKSIEQRMQTIGRVVEAIVEHQMDFFEKGSEFKPMSLHQIAEITELHESTVSRAIRGKYVQTPRGVFEIKKFFVRGMQSTSGEEIATVKIKGRIKELIQKENSKKPLSDQQLSEMLGAEGFVISRRTVAKYREELGIQSSSKRKSY